MDLAMYRDYTTCPEIWDLFCAKWPSGQERKLADLYRLVEQHGLRPVTMIRTHQPEAGFVGNAT